MEALQKWLYLTNYCFGKIRKRYLFGYTSVELSHFDILDTFIRPIRLTISKPTLDTVAATISFLSNSKQF